VQRDELRSFLTEITADRLALLQRHEASARVVSHYDFNNTYQYVIAREETHLTWLQAALEELEDDRTACIADRGGARRTEREVGSPPCSTASSLRRPGCWQRSSRNGAGP
jgi:Mn-containing catalase